MPGRRDLTGPALGQNWRKEAERAEASGRTPGPEDPSEGKLPREVHGASECSQVVRLFILQAMKLGPKERKELGRRHSSDRARRSYEHLQSPNPHQHAPGVAGWVREGAQEGGVKEYEAFLRGRKKGERKGTLDPSCPPRPAIPMAPPLPPIRRGAHEGPHLESETRLWVTHASCGCVTCSKSQLLCSHLSDWSRGSRSPRSDVLERVCLNVLKGTPRPWRGPSGKQANGLSECGRVAQRSGFRAPFCH